MKAEIINVPRKTDSVAVLFAVGLTFRDQEVYLESTGNPILDIHNKKAINQIFVNLYGTDAKIT